MNILIVEDEIQTASLLQEMIEQDSDFMVTQSLQFIAEAVAYLSKYQQNIDLAFFDIRLADGPSFEIFKHVDVTIPIVFCTAYDEYTLQAIKNNGIDYILKPFKEDEIHQALQKYKRLLANLRSRNPIPHDFQTLQKKNFQQNFLTQFLGKSIITRVEDIALFYIALETVNIYTFSGEKLPVFKNLEYIESVCDPATFFRINRQMLVNRNAVVSFEPYFNRKIILHLNIKVEDRSIVSRLKVSLFKKWLEH